MSGQADYVHAHRDWYDPNPDRSEVGLTALYQWYGGDFEQVAGSVLGYVQRYDDALAGAEPSVSFLDYDWSLNGVRNRRPRPRRDGE